MRYVFLISVLVFSIITTFGLTEIPRTMSYQGLLTKTSGVPVDDGNYRLTFRLYNDEISGAVLWSETHVSVPVTKGIFNVILGSVGSSLTLPFNEQYWLGIQVEAGNELTPRLKLTSAPYSLNARTVADNSISTSKLTDNAVTAVKIQPNIVSSVAGVSNDGGNIDIIPQNAITVTPNDTANTITIGESHSARADNPHNTTASQVNAWGLTGNASTTPGTNFLGTTDGKSLELKVNNARALKLEPNSTSPNIICGFSGNTVSSGIYGATIGGGGANSYINQVTKNYGTIGGGHLNTASGEMATVGGGSGNIAQGSSAIIAGGTNNTATVSYASVGGGYSNKAQGMYSSILGGQDNTASSGANYAYIGGGRYNNANYEYSTVGGGFSNNAGANYATISGGGRSNPGDPSTGNRVTDDYGTIGGGGNNIAGDSTGAVNSATYATIGGGSRNIASGQYATVGGGYSNVAFAKGATIAGGGYGNLVTDSFGTIGGGTQNQSGDGATDPESAAHATVGGGYNNVASGEFSFIGGGFSNNAFEKGASIGGGGHNWAAAKYATIAGGGPVDENFVYGNEVVDNYGTVGGGGWNQAGSEDIDPTNSQFATVPGGRENKAIGAYSFAAGRRAIADGAGSFVWGDSNNNDIHAWGANQFVIRATGGVWLITKVAADGHPLEGMMLPANTSKWVPIGSTTAQISQEQADRVQELETENASLKKRIDDLESRLTALEKIIAK